MIQLKEKNHEIFGILNRMHPVLENGNLIWFRMSRYSTPVNNPGLIKQNAMQDRPLAFHFEVLQQFIDLVVQI